MREYPDPRTVTAETVLDGLDEIIAAERLTRNVYLSDEIDCELRDSGALCRGHRACAVGSVWLAGGIEPKVEDDDGFMWMHLPGTGLPQLERLVWLEKQGYTGVLEAYVCLCVAAETYAEERGVELIGWRRSGPLERLFEAGWVDDALIDPAELATVVRMARELIADSRDL